MGIFNRIVDIQDKTLTGSWKAINIFLFMLLVTVGFLLLQKTMNKKEYKLENLISIGVQVALISVIINYITGGLFTSREKMYRKKGFSRQRSRAQAYSDARIGQVMTMMI